MAFLTEDVVRKIGRKVLADMRRERLHRALDAVMDRAGDEGRARQQSGLHDGRAEHSPRDVCGEGTDR